ncbi:hypothetical protein [Caldalkalibacillus mannanilyticus]|uniref:hypothetical protein n=1 Tax=Caldalkalibacillus mannanilyticus TaxID=1418 RepID=UPI00046870AA|nr:hypothetical protein [Caldalkalibacillus mannanilyticus]
MKKLIPIVGKGYTENFFEVNMSDDDLMNQLHLEVDANHFATIAFELNDNGLAEWGLEFGDYLLFCSSAESIRDKLILVRSEEKVIIRQARCITPDISILSTPGDLFPPLTIPSENIRIIAVLSGVIKPYEGLNIVRVGDLV